MYHYNAIIVDGELYNVTPLTDAEYTQLLDSVREEFGNSVGLTITPTTKKIFYNDMVLIETTSELNVTISNSRFYRVKVTSLSLTVEQVSQSEYDKAQSNIDGFNVYNDYIVINNEKVDVIGYYINGCPEGAFMQYEVVEEGFFVKLESAELSTFKWSKTNGGVQS